MLYRVPGTGTIPMHHSLRQLLLDKVIYRSKNEKRENPQPKLTHQLLCQK